MSNAATNTLISLVILLILSGLYNYVINRKRKFAGIQRIKIIVITFLIAGLLQFIAAKYIFKQVLLLLILACLPF